MNVYRYFDYIFTHTELADIYEKAGREYRKKNTNIWAEYDRRHDIDSFIRSSKTTHMEHFDMYCNAVGLDVRVYEKIRHYQECDTPDTCRDFCGALMIRGLDYVKLRRSNLRYGSTCLILF